VRVSGVCDRQDNIDTSAIFHTHLKGLLLTNGYPIDEAGELGTGAPSARSGLTLYGGFENRSITQIKRVIPTL